MNWAVVCMHAYSIHLEEEEEEEKEEKKIIDAFHDYDRDMK